MPTTTTTTTTTMTMTTMESPVGLLRLVASETHLVGVFLPVQALPPSCAGAELAEIGQGHGHGHGITGLPPRTPSNASALDPNRARSILDNRARSILAMAIAQLRAYFAGDRTTFDLPLAPDGTAYQRSVWRALERIPFGETRSYGALAASLGSHSRAVGSANGRNPISIIVPCHRVIAASGDLTGYAGGLDAKRWLLDHEQRTVRACRPGTSSGSSARGSRSSPAADC